jgi:peptidoglycan hydrolase-like protein with peptidoglycan-binding domain
MSPSFDLGVFTPEKKCDPQPAEQQSDVEPVVHVLTEPDNTLATPAPVVGGFSTPYIAYKENVIYSECALAAKWDLSPKMLNLNARALAAEYSDSPVTKLKVKPGKFARSPWAVGVEHPQRDQELTHSLCSWIETTTSAELERYGTCFLLVLSSFHG